MKSYQEYTPEQIQIFRLLKSDLSYSNDSLRKSERSTNQISFSIQGSKILNNRYAYDSNLMSHSKLSQESRQKFINSKIIKLGSKRANKSKSKQKETSQVRFQNHWQNLSFLQKQPHQNNSNSNSTLLQQLISKQQLISFQNLNQPKVILKTQFQTIQNEIQKCDWNDTVKFQKKQPKLIQQTREFISKTVNNQCFKQVEQTKNDDNNKKNQIFQNDQKIFLDDFKQNEITRQQFISTQRINSMNFNFQDQNTVKNNQANSIEQGEDIQNTKKIKNKEINHNHEIRKISQFFICQESISHVNNSHITHVSNSQNENHAQEHKLQDNEEINSLKRQNQQKKQYGQQQNQISEYFIEIHQIEEQKNCDKNQQIHQQLQKKVKIQSENQNQDQKSIQKQQRSQSISHRFQQQPNLYQQQLNIPVFQISLKDLKLFVQNNQSTALKEQKSNPAKILEKNQQKSNPSFNSQQFQQNYKFYTRLQKNLNQLDKNIYQLSETIQNLIVADNQLNQRINNNITNQKNHQLHQSQFLAQNQAIQDLNQNQQKNCIKKTDFPQRRNRMLGSLQIQQCSLSRQFLPEIIKQEIVQNVQQELQQSNQIFNFKKQFTQNRQSYLEQNFLKYENKNNLIEAKINQKSKIKKNQQNKHNQFQNQQNQIQQVQFNGKSFPKTILKTQLQEKFVQTYYIQDKIKQENISNPQNPSYELYNLQSLQDLEKRKQTYKINRLQPAKIENLIQNNYSLDKNICCKNEQNSKTNCKKSVLNYQMFSKHKQKNYKRKYQSFIVGQRKNKLIELPYLDRFQHTNNSPIKQNSLNIQNNQIKGQNKRNKPKNQAYPKYIKNKIYYLKI